MIKGIAVSNGIILGSAYVVEGGAPVVSQRSINGKAGLEEFETALELAEAKLRELEKTVALVFGKQESKIFSVQTYFSFLVKQQPKKLSFKEDVIIVADELSSTQTARMELQKVVGFVTERGGRASHMAVLASALGIPAVVNVKEATVKIKSGDFLILDAMAGIIFVNPKKSIIEEYKKLQEI